MADNEGTTPVGDPGVEPSEAVGATPSDAPENPEASATAGGDRATSESVGTAASRGFLWANVGVFTRYMSALVMAAVLARALTTADYAVMVTLMIVTFYFDNALDLGMGAALIYEQEAGQTERVQVAFTANTILTGVLAVFAFFVAPLVTSFYHLDGYDTVFRLLAVVVVLSGLTTIPWALLMRGMNFRARAAVEVSRDLTRFFVTIGLVALNFEVWGVIIGLIAAYSVWFVFTWVAIKFKPVLRWNGVIVRELFSYAWRMAGTRFLGVLALNGDYLVVGNRRRDEYPLYYQAFRLPEFIMGAQLNAMSAVLFPMYSRIRAEGKTPMSEALYKALRLVALFSIPTGIGLALVSRDAIWVMYGTHNHVAVRTMELLSLAGCAVGIGFASGDLLFALGRPGLMVRINGVMVPSMLLAMWLVSPHGIVWVALVHLVTQFVFQTIRQLIVNRIVEADPLEVVRSLMPGTVVSLGILIVGLPVRLFTSSGFGSMILILVAGVAGGLVGLALSPTARFEVRDVVAKVRG